MRLQPITYRGRVVACASATRVFLADELRDRPTGDPEQTFVMFMCAYALDVLNGELAGPYSDRDARRYARAALVPDELADPEHREQVRRRLPETALALGLPACELAVAIGEMREVRPGGRR